MRLFQQKFVLFMLVVPFLLIGSGLLIHQRQTKQESRIVIQNPQKSYWFVLHRTSNVEYLYQGVAGVEKESKLIRKFIVKTGIPGERPTPLPELAGRKYWVVVNKLAQPDNPETAPYFLTLDVPAPLEEPYGPVPYEECNGQCNWIRPGDFGLHGTAGNPARLTASDPGSSGCIRHSDQDITYLYNLLDPENEEIRYYVVNR